MANGQKFNIKGECSEQEIHVYMQDSSLSIGNNSTMQICCGSDQGSGGSEGNGNGGGNNTPDPDDTNGNGNGNGNTPGDGNGDGNGGNGQEPGDGDQDGDGDGKEEPKECQCQDCCRDEEDPCQCDCECERDEECPCGCEQDQEPGDGEEPGNGDQDGDGKEEPEECQCEDCCRDEEDPCQCECECERDEECPCDCEQNQDPDDGEEPGKGNEDNNGGIDDEDPGDINVTLLGSINDDSFIDVLPTDEGYMALGSHNENSLIATYDKNLKLTSQQTYSSIPAHANTVRGSFMAALPDPAGIVACVTNVNKSGVLHIDPVTNEPLSFNAWDPGKYNTNVNNFGVTNSLVKTPDDFTGAASLVLVGNKYYGYYTDIRENFVHTRDSQGNFLKGVQLVTTNSAFPLRNCHVTKSNILVVGGSLGNFSSGTYGGLLMVLSDVLEKEAAIGFGSGTQIIFDHIIGTPQGYMIGGTIIDSTTNTTKILILELDESYKVLQKAILKVAVGTGAETLGSMSLHANGNLMLAGTTTSVGAGSTDIYLVRLDPQFNVTKEMTFGTAAAESKPAAVYNEDGSITFVCSTAGAGAGKTDACIATIKGNWSDLTGTLKKYPAMRINGKPGFTTDKEFSLERNDAIPITVSNHSVTDAAETITMNSDPGLIVDPNMIVEA